LKNIVTFVHKDVTGSELSFQQCISAIINKIVFMQWNRL